MDRAREAGEMDLAMPEMDGVEATRPVGVKHDALAAGCAEVFHKPLDVESLLRKIKATLGV